MAVWPYMMSGAAVTIAASAIAGNGSGIKSSALILSGLLGARVIHASPISGEYLDVIFAAMWVSVASFIPIAGYGSIATAACVKAAVLICALCSLWGRLTDYTVQMWSPPYMTADLMLILAILCIWWGIRNELVDWVVGTWRVGFDSSDCVGFDNCRSGDTMAQESGPKEVSRNA